METLLQGQAQRLARSGWGVELEELGNGKVMSGWLCGLGEEREEGGLWAFGYASLIGVWLPGKPAGCLARYGGAADDAIGQRARSPSSGEQMAVSAALCSGRFAFAR